jgi:DNA (cytosine-5)-methyltransferase 1
MDYYNEFDPYAAQWLRNLITAGLIPAGWVDERSIVDVAPGDVAGFRQCHFFAGIGGWALALKLSGWPEDRPAWTGSCPCQPLSGAGKQLGHADERHLWPAFHKLIAERRPAEIFGEQVARSLGREWLAGVRADLEALGYAVGAADLCAAGVGAPHIRQRIWWLAESDGRQRDRIADGERRQRDGQAAGWQQGDGEPERCGAVGGVANADGWLARHGGLQPGRQHGQQQEDGGAGGLGDAGGARLEGCDARTVGQQRKTAERASSLSGFWSRYDVVHCTDGKARRFESGSFPLAHGVSNRVGRLRAYGNAINPWLAAEFVKAYLECRP